MSSATEATPTAALMDRIYRRQRHIYDLTRKYYLLGRDRLIRRLDPPLAGSVLEIGCGTGRNLVEVGRRYPGARLYGLDVSAEMLISARTAVSRAGLTRQVSLGLGDATAFDARALFRESSFDRVFFSYSLSMIPDWCAALDHASSLLAPGGRLTVVDFGQQERLPRLFRTLLFAWLRRFHVTPRSDLAAALAAAAARIGGKAGFAPLFGGYAWSGEIVAEHPTAGS